ncbi:MAG: thiamine biosynthesis protein ThiF [Sulfurimonas sp.]|jgi:hypothetical protein|nr:thiamine biosynthesis protein ThiF [Sulfurimonas sp.]
MILGFDLDSPLICEGIIGDGCGGGRLFFVRDNQLRAYDPQSKEETFLLGEVLQAKSISKAGCKIFIECAEEQILFDLSLMAKITSEI